MSVHDHTAKDDTPCYSDYLVSLTTADSQANTVDDRQRWIALVVLCVGMLMIVLDATIVNVALPSIQDDLGFSQSSLAGS